MTMNTHSKVSEIERRFNTDSEDPRLTQAVKDAAELEMLVASLGDCKPDQLGPHIRMSGRLIMGVIAHALEEVGMLTSDIGLAVSCVYRAARISLETAREGIPTTDTLPDLNESMVCAIVAFGYVPATTLNEAETIVCEWLDGIDPSHSASPTKELAVGAARALQATLVILDGGVNEQ